MVSHNLTSLNDLLMVVIDGCRRGMLVLSTDLPETRKIGFAVGYDPECDESVLAEVHEEETVLYSVPLTAVKEQLGSVPFELATAFGLEPADFVEMFKTARGRQELPKRIKRG